MNIKIIYIHNYYNIKYIKLFEMFKMKSDLFAKQNNMINNTYTTQSKNNCFYKHGNIITFTFFLINH